MLRSIGEKSFAWACTVVLLMVMIAACTPAAAPPVSPTLTVPADAASGAPGWLQIPLTDARTGETVMLADYAGKTVYAHPMAVWCLNCRASQGSLRDNVIGQLDPNQFAFVSFSVDPNDDAADLRAYADDLSFPWTFFAPPAQFVQAISEEYGPAVTTPPTQPHFIIRPDGTVTGLMTGNPTPEEVITLMQQVAAGEA